MERGKLFCPKRNSTPSMRKGRVIFLNRSLAYLLEIRYLRILYQPIHYSVNLRANRVNQKSLTLVVARCSSFDINYSDKESHLIDSALIQRRGLTSKVSSNTAAQVSKSSPRVHKHGHAIANWHGFAFLDRSSSHSSSLILIARGVYIRLGRFDSWWSLLQLRFGLRSSEFGLSKIYSKTP